MFKEFQVRKNPELISINTSVIYPRISDVFFKTVKGNHCTNMRALEKSQKRFQQKRLRFIQLKK